ncbi:MAG: CoA protein activase [Candidatus Coatesbacteria bacterium]|nr:CoA protein activase [Candidatus Coatesbacteria bacterium]
MIVTTPRMGLCHIGYRRFLEGFGHTVHIPPPGTKHTLSLGTQHSPEFVCFPFKIIMGQYLQVLRRHPEIEAVFTSGGRGPCRAGLYGVLHREILAEQGHDLRMLLLEPPVIENVKLMSPGLTWRERIMHSKYAWRLLRAVERVEELSHFYRPRELHRGATDAAFAAALTRLQRVRDIIEPRRLHRDLERFFARRVEIDHDYEPVRIGIVGEIFVVLDDFANHDIERQLGYLGAEVQRSLYVTKWLLGGIYRRWTKQSIARASERFLSYWVGGDGRESIGESVMYAEAGYEGVIQLSPFTCIPEIVAKSILPTIGEEAGIAVLSLDIDENTGTAGVRTRLEAFVDMLQRREGKPPLHRRTNEPRSSAIQRPAPAAGGVR